MKKNYPLYIAAYAFTNVVTFGLALVVAGCISQKRISRNQSNQPPLPQVSGLRTAQGFSNVGEDTPPQTLPESVTFELHFSTNVDLTCSFSIYTSTNLPNWEFVDDVSPPYDTFSHTTNWEYTVPINYGESQRFYKFVPHK